MIPGVRQGKYKYKVEFGTSCAQKATKCSEINGAMSKGPRSQQELPPADQICDNFSMKKKNDSYNIPNFKKRSQINMLWEERGGERERESFFFTVE